MPHKIDKHNHTGERSRKDGSESIVRTRRGSTIRVSASRFYLLLRRKIRTKHRVQRKESRELRRVRGVIRRKLVLRQKLNGYTKSLIKTNVKNPYHLNFKKKMNMSTKETTIETPSKDLKKSRKFFCMTGWYPSVRNLF